MRPRQIVFLAIASALLALLHRYLWARLVRDPAWPAPWGRVLTFAIIVLATLPPLTILAMRSTPRALNVPLSWVGYTWMGLFFYLLVLTTAGDIMRLLAGLFGALPTDPERRRTLARVLAAATGAIAAALGAGGIAHAGGFVVRRVRVPLRNLPAGAA